MNSIANLFGWRRPLSGSLEFTDDLVYPVHLHDANFAKLLMACTMRFDGVLDAEKLHSALSRLLEIGDWKKVGGRLRRNPFKVDGRLEIHTPIEYSAERPAVTYSRADLSLIRIGDHDLGCKLPRPTPHTSIHPTPYQQIDLAIREDMPRTIDEMVDRDIPQISLHVVSFQDATLVSIAWPHSVMGSAGFGHLVRAWSLVVSGNESEVPPFLGARTDVLLEAEDGEGAASREELLVAKDRLSGLSLLAFLLRLIWGMRKTREVKSVMIPKQAVQKLLGACQQEIFDTTAPQASAAPPVDGTTILAWFARLATSGSSDNKPITVVSMSNAAYSIPSLVSNYGVNIHNMTTYAFSFLPGAIARGRLGPLVKEHTHQMQQQQAEKQCLSFLRMVRRTTEHSGSFKPLYGPSDAHTVVCCDMTAADPLRSADFGAAVVEKSEGASSGAPGTMTCLYYHMIKGQLGAGLDCIYLLGKDGRENLWVAAALPAETWQRVEAALKDY
ncbi:hypothetical protein NLG97_g9380 [Lecanicillium saksenae]|uniref:Uncharacterized protein n=1 Tax=Lecanicillium saksenae TaxID=468837 RepID=A0ACC1QI10_9HYPO|nr:hypothetical protein NLG97_g9380 [Lecanicillium saksenae]